MKITNKYVKKISVGCILALVMSMVFLSLAFADQSTTSNDGKYLPSQVLTALSQKSMETTSSSVYHIFDDVILPSSMNIDVPNINMDKVIDTTPLNLFPSVFKDDLMKHGYNEKQIASFTYDDYQNIAGKWKLEKEQIKAAKSLYPELNNVDISNWTNKDFENYYTKVDRANLANNFTKNQLQQLEQKGIRLDDTFYLFKEYYTPDTILAQPDEALKRTIQGYYQFKLDQLKLLATTPDLTYYQLQTMPRYGTDYFLKSVCTSGYWLDIQSARTLRALGVLYNTNFSTFNNTIIQNMYGTYSTSQGGAHEGIDFAYGGDGTMIYAIFDGQVIAHQSGYPHQLCVYDSGAGKSYNYLHMSYNPLTPGTAVIHGNSVGHQGQVGNASGPHVHFEVHSGSTNTLSSEHNNALESISPYQLQIYLGGS